MRPIASSPTPRTRALLKFSVAMAVIAVLMTILLDRLNEIQEYSERTVMEATLRNMQSGLRLEIAARIVRGEEAALPALIGRNPVEFLEQLPAGYQGACGHEKRPGSWCFDEATREIVYRPRLDRRLVYPAGADRELRWRIVGKPADGGRVGTIALVSAGSFAWH